MSLSKSGFVGTMSQRSSYVLHTHRLLVVSSHPFSGSTRHRLNCVRHSLVPYPLQLLHSLPCTTSCMGCLHAPWRPIAFMQSHQRLRCGLGHLTRYIGGAH